MSSYDPPKVEIGGAPRSTSAPRFTDERKSDQTPNPLNRPSVQSPGLTDDDYARMEADSKVAELYDRAYTNGYNRALARVRSELEREFGGPVDYIGRFIQYALFFMTLYAIFYLISAGWHDGE